MKSMKGNGVVLIGPTGSGKTPLGIFLEGTGLWGRPCLHFDFGEILREVDRAPHAFSALPENAVEIVRDSLKTGALLENDTFYIAERLLEDFIQKRSPADEHLLLLNGLPRHAGQAGDVSRTVQVRAVISLLCPAETVLARIRNNTGEDRKSRSDDSIEAVRNKIKIFEQRTRPLLAYYAGKKIPVLEIEVAADTGPGSVALHLESLKPAGIKSHATRRL